MNLVTLTRQVFKQHFGYEAEQSYQAPGRVNLIGEHTDYNQGFVLPCAIDYQTVISLAKRNDNQVRVVAADYQNQLQQFSLTDPITPVNEPMWSNYVRGVIKHLLLKNRTIGGMDLVISGNVPQGAGLSSSASLEVALGTAINQLWQLGLSAEDVALNGQQAENQFVGCNCGIMDQMISALGQQHHALLLDCRSLKTEAVVMPAEMAVVIVNSNFRRTLVGSEYNARREQCQQGAAFFSADSLRDVTLAQFEQAQAEMDPLVAKRVRHILTENQRTRLAAECLRKGDLQQLGQLMAQSHQSMRDDFEITVKPVDILVEILQKAIGNAGGARMTGGGFGGCVVALLPESMVEKVRAEVAAQYQALTGIKETFYVCKASQGASYVENQFGSRT